MAQARVPAGSSKGGQFAGSGGPGGKRPSGKISGLQKTRAFIKKQIGVHEKKIGEGIPNAKRDILESATKFKANRGKERNFATKLANISDARAKEIRFMNAAARDRKAKRAAKKAAKT